MRKRILITGGTGFIGSAIAKLIALENDVVIVDNNQRGFSRRLNIIKNKIDFKNFDVRDEKNLLKHQKEQTVLSMQPMLMEQKHFIKNLKK